MDLSTMEVPQAEARAKVAEYLKAVRERHDEEDAAILRGYRAMAKGHALISLPDVIGRGGCDEHGRPKLAMARADERTINMTVAIPWSWRNAVQRSDGEAVVTFGPQEAWRLAPSRARKVNRNITVRVSEWALDLDLSGLSRIVGSAIVPIVPPALRPATGLSGYHVLFEAEWLPVPPRDPALLKHVGGDLWAVCATWDLTDLELAVLAGRANDL